MNNSNRNAGFTITDIIMGMSIIAIAVVGVLSIQNNYVNQASQIELRTRAVSLGNAVMSTVRMHRFDENTGIPWTSNANLGSDSESMSGYDDVDDYVDASWDFSSLGYAGFTVTTRIFYVNIANSWVDSVAGPTDYKRIIVGVNNAELSTPVRLSTLVGGGY